MPETDPYRAPAQDFPATTPRSKGRGWHVHAEARNRGGGVVLLCALILSVCAQVIYAGDILRGGATAGSARKNTEARQNAGAQAASLAKAKAQDRLARTTKAINDMRQLQAAARAAAGDGGVPDGLTPGGLERLAGGTWTGANAPVQSGNAVNITQTKQQALLDWKTFNVGKNTSLNFDQTAGGADSGKWIAFNKVFDPSGKPSQIRGQIKADGQVYIINQNGIIFGAGSQVNARTLVASSLPINDNLIANGLLNHAKNSAEFLFSAAASTSSVIVEPGATITATTSVEGSGGRVVLAGATVLNQGTIETPSGQTILAAGLEIGFDSHSKAYPAIPDREQQRGSDDDPSLRGIDAYVGEVGPSGGTVTNSGYIGIPTGSLIMVGKQVDQMGVVDSQTSVTLNGRIDLIASYGAVPNTNYNPDIKGQLAFLNQRTGTLRLGDNSVSRILPDYLSPSTTVGKELPIKSQANLVGNLVSMGRDAMLQVPNGDIAVAAGDWRPIAQQTADRFVFSSGQFFMDTGAYIDASGTTEVFVPLKDRILTVQLRGSELSLSPLQRDGELRGEDLLIDTRRTGSYNGQYWVGTPLGDAAGFLDVIQKNASQLTADGGSVKIRAGGSFVAQQGSVIDVSGGYYKHEGGKIRTTRLRQGSRLVNIADALPDQVYDGIFTSTTSRTSSKWGVTKTFATALAPTGGYTEAGYIDGAAGGKLQITAPAMVLDGELLGATIVGPRQLRSAISSSSTLASSNLPDPASLTLTFESQENVVGSLFPTSPTPPRIELGTSRRLATVTSAHGTIPAILPSERLESVVIPADFFEKSGFSSVEIVNKDGEFVMAPSTKVDLPEKGSLTVHARNISLDGTLRAPGGTLDFTAYNLSPYKTAIQVAKDNLTPQPKIDSADGTIRVSAATRLDVSGLITDDRTDSLTGPVAQPVVTDGGKIRLVGYNVLLDPGSVLDVSGGVSINPVGKYASGDAGSITVAAGQDFTYPSVLGGRLALGATLRGFAGKGAEGGAISVKAPLIQVGGVALAPSTLLLDPSFFSQGGFQNFQLTGIGAPGPATTDPDAPDSFLPAVYVAPNTAIQPVVQSLVYRSRPKNGHSTLEVMTRPLGERNSASITLSSSTVRNSFYEAKDAIPVGDRIVVRGDILLDEKASIITEPGGDVTLSGSTVTVRGTVVAPGGDIKISGAGSFPMDKLDLDNATFARPTVHIAPTAVISAAGASVLLPDAFGRRLPKVYDGGTVTVSGNIIAEGGALLDVSGTSVIKDAHPAEVGLLADGKVPTNSGLNTRPYSLRTVPHRIDSDGGTITLAGSEMLLTDATLVGRAGGPTAIGGTLVVSSGLFSPKGSAVYGSSINLRVTQNSQNLLVGSQGIGRQARAADGTAVTGMGYFAADSFQQGGFDSLDLGFNTTPGAGKPKGGNVEFRGPVTISAPGSLRVASGGVIRADAPVTLSANYIAVGQPFSAPLTPSEEQNFLPFEKDEPGINGSQEFVPPTSGAGSIAFNAGLLDVGTIVFKNTSRASFSAPGGDIRGVGTLSIRGDLELSAAQIYPATLSNFHIFAYDPAGGTGSVTVRQSGKASAPLSAGGSLSIQASVINQGGTLLAPFGSIVLGWDGTDLDVSTAALDIPENKVVGTTLAVPKTARVTLESGSLTSVSGIDYSSGQGLLIPFGLSADGLTIIDPRGIDVTSSGLPAKTISIAGEQIQTDSGSTIDIRGGGDMFSFRWVSGTGGTIDYLGSPSKDWSSGTDYSAGDLVRYSGTTYSARVAIDPDSFDGSGPEPGVNRYWSKVSESYAVVPGYAGRFAPYAAFNTSDKATALGGDPGYVSRSLRLGDRITIDRGSGLEAGTYTLLPSRYALLPGAYLVTPQSSGRLRQIAKPEGASLVTGYTSNVFSSPAVQPTIRSLYEILSPEVLSGRARYEAYDLSAFISSAAIRNDLSGTQYVPRDSGYLAIHGNSALQLGGSVRSSPTSGGRGSRIDISSFADITIVGDGQSATGGVTLQAGVLSGFGAESLLVGGLRTFSGNTASVQVRTGKIVLENAGTALQGPEVNLAAKREIHLAGGSVLEATGSRTETGRILALSGDGALVQASADNTSKISRTGVTASSTPLLTIQSGARVSGAAVTLDSSYGFALGEGVEISAGSLMLGAGQIGLLLTGPTALTGQIDPLRPQLVLQGRALANVQQVNSLTLLSYQSTIDIYGPGVFGAAGLQTLTLQAGAVRGFGQGAGTVSVRAGSIVLSNSRNVAAPADGAASGRLSLDANSITIADGTVHVQGYSNLALNAEGGILFAGKGSLLSQQSISGRAPLITVSQGADQSLVARAGSLNLDKSFGTPVVAGGLGGSLSLRGTTARIDTDITAPSGSLSIETDGDLVVGGILNTRGTSKAFYDVTRYSNGGEVSLTSRTGNVRLEGTSNVSVAAHAGGGDAGRITIRAGGGQFTALGKFDGQAGAGGIGGSFTLDALSLASLNALRDLLNAGGISESRSIRVRTGDLTVTGTHAAREFSLSADGGSIIVAGSSNPLGAGRIDASGLTGGSISLFARNDVTLESGAILTARGLQFSNAGKGGEINIEAGASVGGSPNLAGRVNLLTGSTIDLSVAGFVAGDYTTVGSSSFYGQFQGTLHLRAPQINGNTDVGVNALLGTINGASSVLVEGYRVYTPVGGVMNTTLRNQINTDGITFLGAAGTGNANETAMRARLLAGAPGALALTPLLVIAPGAEIVNAGGDLTLGLANPTGSTTAAAVAQAHTAADWDLSTFRYGSKRAPGVLTLRASGDLVFNNTLSDGFTSVTVNAASGFSRMWLSPLMSVNSDLPVNTQSWSYRLTAGSDLGSAASQAVLPLSSLAAGKGSILVGEFYPAVLNSFTTGDAAGSGANGQTADSIRFVTSTNDATNRGTRFEVIRTGTGDISLSAGRDVQLRNQFATVYTAGVGLPNRTQIFQANDFVVPIISRSSLGLGNPPADGNLGAIQQTYGVWYAMAGGDISIQAQADIGRFTFYNGSVVSDTSRQVPTNWLYRRGYVDGSGVFGSGGVGTGGVGTVVDASASTTWWIDYSNFFQGFGALGGGDISLSAGDDIINADAVIPTNARMAGRDPATGKNIAPSETKLLELGGGDLSVRAGNNIDGGMYYVERGAGSLFASGEVTTNSARTISQGILNGSNPLDPLTWMPTTLFVGKSSFDVTARGNVLIGPVSNPFLLPQGMNNRFWYKTQFNTFSPDASADIASYGGTVTHRLDVTLPGDIEALPVLYYWTQKQNTYSTTSAAYNQPWIRLAETSVINYRTVLSVGAPDLSSISFAGDINIVGDMVLYPSPRGSLEILSSGGLPGIQKSGPTKTSDGLPYLAWTSATVQLSDADPAKLPGAVNPIAFRSLVGSSSELSLLDTFNLVDPLSSVSPSFRETGATEGADAAVSRQNALHASSILHKNSSEPLRIYTLSGDITGLTLYSAKQAQVVSSRDINDIAFYLQNPTDQAVSIVSAGRDLILFNENSPLRALAGDEDLGNLLVDASLKTSAGDFTKALAGDIQISGEGVLEVLAGRNIDLGTGSNFEFGGLARGITSVGRQRNPFLPFDGARLVIMGGLKSTSGGAALGLRNSSLNFTDFIQKYVRGAGLPSEELEDELSGLDSLSSEMQAVLSLDVFFALLRQSAVEAAETGTYDSGYAFVDSLFGSASGAGEQTQFQRLGWNPWESSQQVVSNGQIFTRVRDIRTTSGGSITLATPQGGITMAPTIFGNPLTPPGIVTEFGGSVSIFMDGSLNIGQARVFTLRGGDVTIWSSNGDIAAGAAAKTVVTAPPTRVSVDRTSALLTTDLGGLATGGGIGVLASVEGVEAGTVSLIAPKGTVDAGDAGIRATGDITIAAAAVVNADNIAAGGTSTGVPSAPVVAAPNVGGLSSGSASSAAASSAANQVTQQAKPQSQPQEEAPSVISVEVLGYGGDADEG